MSAQMLHIAEHFNTRPTFLVGPRGHEALLDGVVVQRVAGQAVEPRRSQLHAAAARELRGGGCW